MIRNSFFALTCLAAVTPLAVPGDLPPGVTDTQKPGDTPPSPQRAADLFELPDGFDVTVFAAEPDVRQPIAMTFDHRGRLWVAECYSYPDWKPDGPGKDRILIFEDTDFDGRFDNRTVFWDRARNLTGLEIGDGGIYVLCAPQMLFIPDRDGDDEADGDGDVLLDGFTLKAGHNVVNGLAWGPDGWLYGRHGITAESLLTRPEFPDEEPTKLNCSIWRYHTNRKTFEVVANGTTNPWGLDWNEHGEAFFTNCVIGHLWHLIPGAHYQRMFGTDYNKYTYELIGQTADHLHWGGGDWTTSRGGEGVHSEAGGGHAHTGGMVYLGDNWPEEYRGRVYTCNLHGNRVNRDRLERRGNSYVGIHEPDILYAKENPWFRGVSLIYGPSGAVYVSDWSDLGECHDNDGVHRSSGRIYRVSHGEPKRPEKLDLSNLNDAELIALHAHPNEWYARQARRILAQRALAPSPQRPGGSGLHDRLIAAFDAATDVTEQLRLMWTLHAVGGTDETWLRPRLDHPDEHVRSWAIRLLCDHTPPSERIRAEFARMAKADKSGLVRLYLAAMLQRLPIESRLPIAEGLVSHAVDADDRCQPLMIWYGIESATAAYPDKGLRLASVSRIPQLRHSIARRLTEAGDKGLGAVVSHLSTGQDADIRADLLAGIRQGIRGRKQVRMPNEWPAVSADLRSSASKQVQRLADSLALKFGEPGAELRIREAVATSSVELENRRAALQALVESRVPKLSDTLLALLDEPSLRRDAIRALAAYPDDRTPKELLARYAGLTDAEKQDAITTLASRPEFADRLLTALEEDAIPRKDVSAFTARQLQSIAGGKFKGRVETAWGQIRNRSKDREQLIERYQAMLMPNVIENADPSRGRAVFAKTCAQCHRLYGEGSDIGPDLTGSDRKNLYYVLENLIDPSAVIGGEYRLTSVATFDGRFVSGIIAEETDHAIALQTATERLVIAKDDIDEQTPSNVSMMPEGQIEQLTAEQLRDLVGYLRTERQVPLPE